MGQFSQSEIQRYARHIVLSEIGGSGQKELKKSKVVVIGVGGLGIPVLQYLNAAGVGTLKFVDPDTVSLPNLQRQVIFSESHVGQRKVDVAQDVLRLQNSNSILEPTFTKLEKTNAEKILKGFDVIIDSTDSFEARQLINRICVEQKLPMIFGAISQWEGQISVFFGQPCFECIFPVKPEGELLKTCSEFGVVASLPGIIGSMMATEAIKLITSSGCILKNKLLIIDALNLEVRMLETEAKNNCRICGH